ncbi:MAG TPA: serine/threonine-protein kinase [Herpetosiphonaceae bacterium]
MTTHSITQRILCPICRAPNKADANFCQQCGHDVLLDDTYRITRVIKEGGMGVVYQAVDDDGAVYAIKEMHDRFTNAQEREEGIKRFVDEAQLLRKIKGHPGIPHIYRSFIDEGRYYLSMEFIFGDDLEDLLKQTPRFPEAQVLIWAEQLCDVLEFLHQNGLIYRDMKPSNVMITADRNVKVVDFGIAKLLQPGHRGTMIGTPGYAPPEQYQGIATIQSDVYALAATLHHLLTGRDPREEPPFSFPSARSVQSNVSLETSQVLDKALQLELEDRFKTISEFRRALPIVTGERLRTRTFDPLPEVRAQRPAAQQQPQQRPAQRQAQPLPTPPKPAPRPAPRSQQLRPPRRRSAFGRAVRGLFAAGLITGGLYFGALMYRPELVAPIQEYVTSLVQEYVPGQGSDVPSTGSFVLEQFRTEVEIEVTEGASQQVISEQFRQAYLSAAQQQYPGAQLSNIPLGNVGQPTVVSSGAGYQRLRATIQGYINVPQQ